MLELKADKREQLGKKTNALRRAGFLPAVIYGEGIKSESLSISYKDFEKIYKEAGESTLIKLNVANKPHNVLIYDVKHDPITDRPIHADFYAVRMDKEIKTKVPVEFFGESPAVKNDGGIIVRVMQEIEIEALPQNLPHSMKIDISSLVKFEDRVFVKDFVLPEGVKILADENEVIVLVEPPRSEDELAKLTEVAETAPVEVKTEKEIKAEAKKEAEKATEEVAQETEKGK